MSVLYPGSASLREYWRGIVGRRDHLSDVPASRWALDDFFSPDPAAPDRTYSRRGGFIADVGFDPVDWGIPPASLAATDPVQLLTLLVAKQALRDAVGSLDQIDGERVSVFMGASGATQLATTMAARLQRPSWRKALVASGIPDARADEICDRIAAEYPAWQESVFPGYLNNVIAGRVANRLNLRGTNCTMDAACASSLAALKMAAQELWLGEADLVLTGGADALCDPLGFLSFAKCSALSKTDDCRPFSSKADGTIISEGVGVVVLERLADAERNGHRIYAVLRGIGSSSDGRGTAIYAPSSEGQALAMRRAYANAGVGPETVELLEAHGTGTPAGELAEVQAARRVFGESGRRDGRWCALGSIKSQIGHTKAAAGVAGLVKAALALHHRVIPPTIKVDEPNPALDLDSSPFYVSTAARPWIRSAEHPRRAAVSSFGFGGTNFHVVLEEYCGDDAHRAARIGTSRAELFAVGAADREQAAAACIALADALDREPSKLEELARRSRAEWVAGAAVRVAVVGEGAGSAAARLRSAASGLRGGPVEPRGVAVGTDLPEGRLAFVFPGQGSQYVGMSGELAMEYPEARAPWDLAASLRLAEGSRLHDVVFPPPVFSDGEREAQRRQLTATEWAQPALAAASLSWLAALRRLGVRPDCVAGHSFGELVALHAADVLSARDLLVAGRRRGELMGGSPGEGAMTAVVASREQVQPALEGVDDVVVANHNAPSQVVLSGRAASLERVESALAARGIAFTRLPVSCAFHSALVAGSVAPFLEHLESVELRSPTIPVYGNTAASPYPADPDEIRAALARQLAEPVRFVDQINAMYAAGVRTFVEVGPKSVLTRLISSILEGRPHRVVALDAGTGDALASLHVAVATLVAAGVPLDLRALDAGTMAAPETAPRSKVSVEINGALRTRAAPPAHPAPRFAAPAPNGPVVPAVPAVASERSGERILPRAAPAIASRANVRAPVARLEAAEGPDSARLLQDRILEVHASYQRAMSEAHLAFIAAAGASLGARGGAARAPERPGEAAPLHRAAKAATLARAVGAGEAASLAVRAENAPRELPASLAGASGPAHPDLLALLTAIVCEKTGFPGEAMHPTMDLERDLGIDSIKRVEILAELRKRVPELAGVKPAALVARRTLADIAQFLNAGAGEGGEAAPVRAAASSDHAAVAVSASAPCAAAPAGDPVDLLRAVISEKTGFPTELIQPEMDLQQDLGVDSIKRIEVLVALRSLVPALAGVQPADLAPLKTVSQVAAFVSRRSAN